MFEKFLSFEEVSTSNYDELMCPLIQHYLDYHASYYNPRVDNRERTQLCAITAEKIQIAK